MYDLLRENQSSYGVSSKAKKGEYKFCKRHRTDSEDFRVRSDRTTELAKCAWYVVFNV